MHLCFFRRITKPLADHVKYMVDPKHSLIVVKKPIAEIVIDIRVFIFVSMGEHLNWIIIIRVKGLS